MEVYINSQKKSLMLYCNFQMHTISDCTNQHCDAIFVTEFIYRERSVNFLVNFVYFPVHLNKSILKNDSQNLLGWSMPGLCSSEQKSGPSLCLLILFLDDLCSVFARVQSLIYADDLKLVAKNSTISCAILVQAGFNWFITRWDGAVHILLSRYCSLVLAVVEYGCVIWMPMDTFRICSKKRIFYSFRHVHLGGTD